MNPGKSRVSPAIAYGDGGSFWSRTSDSIDFSRQSKKMDLIEFYT